jgi:transcriptional regulator with XRE-family HTH domain
MSIKKMELQELVGERITQLRKLRKVTQQNFSYEANIERSYLTNIEKGRKNISMSTLSKLIQALDVTPTEFFNSKEFENKI